MGAMGQSAVTPERILQMAWGYAPPLMIEAGVRHRVFDILDEGPKDLQTVARLSGASVRGLRAVMNALVGYGLLLKNHEGQYSLASDAAAFLVSSKPGYLGGLARHTTDDLIPRWLALRDVVQTGKPAAGVNQQQAGSEFFEHFVEDLFPMNYPAAQALARALDLANVNHPVKVLDLAAGSGVWGIALAQSSPRVAVTAVDWPNVLEVTRRVVARRGVAERYSYAAGDLAAADFGRGYDIAVLGHILHSEGERRSRALLKKTHDALKPGGTIAIAEFLVDDDRTGPPLGLTFAVNMLVATDEGDTYSFREIAGWLRDAGFEDARTVDAPGPSPLILATVA
ncbi:MAG: methyltransferase domain-containing protein [Acidobacteriia bacterium]|nr:methyltransferase domain-containing protein [Terriglobia bacterium]